jgi:SAM-dependent methyltransferase
VVKLWLENDVNVYDEIKTEVVNKYHCDNCGLSFFDPVNAGGDKFYSRLAEYEWYYRHPGKTEYEYVQQWIKENDYVLDIGSGRGELYTRTNKKINYTGLELSTKAAELAQEAGINVINEDLLVHADKYPGRYDLAGLFQVLEHLTELDNFIGAIKKTLKPGGHLCVAVPNNDGFLKLTTNNAFNMPPHHTLHWNRQSLEKLGELFGLKVVDVHLEKLQDVHKDWYLNTMITRRIRNIINKKHRTVDLGFGYLKAYNLASRLRSNKLTGGFFRKAFLNKDTTGHSIIVVYQKPA